MTGTITTTTAKPLRIRPERSRSTVSVRAALDEHSRQFWSAYVARHPFGTPFHDPKWCSAVQAVFEHRPLHRLAYRGDDLVGVLPMMEVRSFLVGRLLVSVPYATYGGILADDDQARSALAEEAMTLVDNRHARSLDVRSQSAEIPQWEHDTRYARFARMLPRSVGELDAFLPRKARAAARQAVAREGLSVAHDVDALGDVWRLYARSMRRLGSINYPYTFFDELVQRFGDDAWVTLVLRDRTLVAGLLSLVHRETVYPYFLGVDERCRATGATNLIYRAVMQRAIERGLQRFDFGRTRYANKGPFEFKRNQGFEPVTLGYQRYIPAGGKPFDLTPANPRFQIARRAWRYLPLSLTTRAGAWLAKSIPG